MKTGKVENFWDKISLTGYKGFSLNAPSTDTPVFHVFLEGAGAENRKKEKMVPSGIEPPPPQKPIRVPGIEQVEYLCD